MLHHLINIQENTDKNYIVHTFLDHSYTLDEMYPLLSLAC